MVLGIGFVIGMYTYRASVVKGYEDCINKKYEEGKISYMQKDLALDYQWDIFGGHYEYYSYDEDVDECVQETQDKAGLTFVFLALWICCFVGASIPCYIMCCCATNPDQMSPSHTYQMTYVGLPTEATYKV
eukprot:TRINITY_DN13522_c0_g1_i2.p2 TRINITY_DN13522_c0_g1~~TRINITY_DN13522_c0_g1_i2.p2  ORF type:complete len:131 (-),score=9.35 TRINITY_DN13522_c0_g1_i2:247-639(-)